MPLKFFKKDKYNVDGEASGSSKDAKPKKDKKEKKHKKEMIPEVVKRVRLAVTNAGGKGESGEKTVGSDAGSDTTKVDVYTITPFKLEYSVDLPVATGFFVCEHAKEPTLFVTGGTPPEEEGKQAEHGKNVWRIDLDPEKQTLTQLADMPQSCEGHMSCVCRHGDRDYLYIFGPEDKCTRLNLEVKEWEDAPNAPVAISEMAEVFSNGDLITIVTTDNRLLCYEEQGESFGSWECRLEKGFPGGQHTMNKEFMYSYDNDQDVIHRCDITNPKMETVDHELDAKAMKKNIAIAGCENYLFFVGHHYAPDHVSVMELEMPKKEGVVSGYIQDVSNIHSVHGLLMKPKAK